MTRDTLQMLTRLQGLGVSTDDALALRRISMTLHRWHELECGDSNDYSSWCITRGRKETRHGQHAGGHGAHYVFIHDDNGDSYLERHYHQGPPKAHYSRIPDRERGARKRLAGIMARYPALAAYVQTDPRGAALYVGAKADMRADRYTNGVAVYR